MSDPGRTARERLERLIAASGDYVQPTEDLRPRVLELARRQSDGRREGCRLAAWTLAACLCVTVGGSIGGRFPTAGRGQLGGSGQSDEIGQRDGGALRGWWWRAAETHGSASGADSNASFSRSSSGGGLARELTEVVGRWRSERVLGRAGNDQAKARVRKGGGPSPGASR